MSDTTQLPAWPKGLRRGWLNRLVAQPAFQNWASKFPLTRRQARADGAALFDIVQGFVSSQALMALVELDVFRRLRGGPLSAHDLGKDCHVPEARMHVLLQAGSALGLIKRRKNDRFSLARKGAALIGVPGLEAMIRHHKVFYDDLRDPVALLRDPEETELSKFWPYVFGTDVTSKDAETYSDLMSQSQSLVALDTLAAVKFDGVRHLMDVGGGSGAFLKELSQAEPQLRLTLFDLPHVVSQTPSELRHRIGIAEGSFRTDALPSGADAISLVRVLYDHSDETVRALLSKAHDALPKGGRLIVSEPMSGGTLPERAGDVYFAFYTMAMKTGRVRSSDEIGALCAEAGFENIQSPSPRRPYVTRVLTAQRRT